MLAANLDLNTIQGNANISAPSSLGGLITNVLPYVFGIAGILLLVYLVLGGFQLMTSRGDPKGVAGAWAKITNALIGFLIVSLAFVITRFVGQIFGFNVFEKVIGK